jgi:hypothetical protein
MPLDALSKNYIQSLEVANRDLIIGDAFQMLYSDNGALVFTVPADLFGEGTQISLCDFDGGGPVFAAGAGVTLSSNGTLGPTAQFTVATIIQSPIPNEWIVVGNV